MAREIKFRRAYFRFSDGGFERFIEWGPHDNGEFTSPAHVHGCKAGPDMQFTGLRDRDDVEIYEGDVVKAFIGGDHYGTGQVVFGSGIFWIQWINDKQADMEPVSCLNRPFGKVREPLEVIGNIHQHRHLLE